MAITWQGRVRLRATPLNPLADALRAVATEGASLASQGDELALPVGWAVVAVLAALRLFRWDED